VGGNAKAEGEKGYVSVAMKDSHQAIGVLSNNCLCLMLRLGLIMIVRGTNQQRRLTRMQVTCLTQQIPNFDLEDKDRVPGGAIDRRCYLYLYFELLGILSLSLFKL
jgi:hypothetical protein